MKYFSIALIAILCCLSVNELSAKTATIQTPIGENTSQFEEAEFQHQGKSLPYRILKPKGFDSSKKYPLHLFLHGSGERGNDNQAQLVHGSSLFEKMSTTYPAIVIFPQCPSEDYWAQIGYSRDPKTGLNAFSYHPDKEPTWALSAVIALMDSMTQEAYVNKNRVYIGGLSMGGMGTFEMLVRRPDMFAAATPICGGGAVKSVASWAEKVPAWIFHGDSDTVVPPHYSKVMVETLIKLGKEPKFSLYSEVGHNSWDNAFAEKDFFSWIYSHSK